MVNQLFITDLKSKDAFAPIYYYPENINSNIFGICRAFMDFVPAFGRIQNCRYVLTHSCLIIFYIVDNILICLILSKNLNILNKEGLYAFLKRAYFEFRFLNGPLFQIRTHNSKDFLAVIKSYFDKFMQKLDELVFSNPSSFWIFNTLKYGYKGMNITYSREPMPKDTFIQLQSDLSSLETLYVTKGLLYTILFKRYKSIIWSSIEDPPLPNLTSNTKDLDINEESEENCLTSNILIDYLSEISQLIFPDSPSSHKYELDSLTKNSPQEYSNILAHNGKFLSFKLLNSPYDSPKRDDDGHVPEVSIFRDIWLPTNNYSEPYILIAYQIYSYIIALIFSKRAIERYLYDPSSDICRDFLNLLKMDLNERIGRKHLLTNYCPSPICIPHASDNFCWIEKHLKYLIIDQSLCTFYGNISFFDSSFKKGSTQGGTNNYIRCLHRLLTDFQNVSAIEITGKYEHESDRNSFWFVIRKKNPKIYMLVCPVNTMSKLSYNGSQMPLYHPGLKKEFEIYLSQL